MVGGGPPFSGGAAFEHCSLGLDGTIKKGRQKAPNSAGLLHASFSDLLQNEQFYPAWISNQ